MNYYYKSNFASLIFIHNSFLHYSCLIAHLFNINKRIGGEAGRIYIQSEKDEKKELIKKKVVVALILLYVNSQSIVTLCQRLCRHPLLVQSFITPLSQKSWTHHRIRWTQISTDQNLFFPLLSLCVTLILSKFSALGRHSQYSRPKYIIYN